MVIIIPYFLINFFTLPQPVSHTINNQYYTFFIEKGNKMDGLEGNDADT